MPAVTIPGNTPYNPADLTQCPLVIPEAKSISPSNEPATYHRFNARRVKRNHYV